MIWSLIILLLGVVSSALSAEHDVLLLTDDDFSTRLGEHDTVLVMFFAPWCGHCKRLKPEYEGAAGLLQSNDPPVILAKVDCTEGGKQTCNKFGVSGYPTLKIFRNGEFSQEYSGPRETNGIVKYMKSQVGPSSRQLSSKKAFTDFISKDDVAVVGLFKEDSSLKSAFRKVADKLRERARFGDTSDDEVLKEQGYTNDIVLYRPKHLHNKFEPNTVRYDGDGKKEDIENWVNKNYHGICGHRLQDNANEFSQPLVVAYYNVDYVKNPKGTNYWRNRILKVAQSYIGKLNFAISAKDDFQHELNEYGYDYVAGDKPIVFAKNSQNQKFVMKDEFTIENFDTYLKKLDAGELEPYLKSEPVPEDNSGPVTVAVAKNFDEVVINNEKDSLVEFYAPWCGHCKKLGPTFDELGTKLKDEDVAIIKIDATANDVPAPFEVRGFPTIYWAPKNDKQNPVRYEGGRDLDDFIKYIAEHATSELKSYDRSGNLKKEEL